MSDEEKPAPPKKRRFTDVTEETLTRGEGVVVLLLDDLSEDAATAFRFFDGLPTGGVLRLSEEEHERFLALLAHENKP